MIHPPGLGSCLLRTQGDRGKHGYKIKLETGTQLFLYQIVGTWGQLLFPKPWKEFRLWYDSHKAKGIKPFLEGMVTTGWYKKMGERIWTPWFIKFIHSRGYYNIYTNFLNERALSISHRDAGVNYGKTAGPDSHLLNESALDFNVLEMQPLTKLKWYDFCFREVYPDRVIRRFDELESVLHSVQKLETILLVSLYGVPEMVSKNMICNFERLNIQNYIFISTGSGFLYDIARRGHPVIVADHFVKSLRNYDAKNFQDRHVADLVNTMLVKAYVVKKCLQYHYSSWMMDGNMLLVSSLSNLEPDPANDFYIGKSSEVFFIRSSYSAKKIWDDKLISNIIREVGLVNKNGDKSFVHTVTKLLESKGVMVRDIDETSYTIKISNRSVNESSLGDKKKIVSWSSEMSLDIIWKRLEEMGLWMLDNDLSCKAVVCHQS